jgi:hypothetical protein
MDYGKYLSDCGKAYSGKNVNNSEYFSELIDTYIKLISNMYHTLNKEQ